MTSLLGELGELSRQDLKPGLPPAVSAVYGLVFLSFVFRVLNPGGHRTWGPRALSGVQIPKNSTPGGEWSQDPGLMSTVPVADAAEDLPRGKGSRKKSPV